MDNLHASDSLIAKMPEPPIQIRSILQEYQDFLGSIFEREYQTYNPLGTKPIAMPKLSQEEVRQVSELTEKIHSMPEWKEYTKQCKRWAVLM